MMSQPISKPNRRSLSLPLAPILFVTFTLVLMALVLAAPSHAGPQRTGPSSSAQGDGATTVIGGIQRSDPAQPAGPGGISSGLKADIIGTALGFSLAGGLHLWGSTIVVDNPAHVVETGVDGQYCRFRQAAYRPFNKGDVQSGAFMNRVYRGSDQVHASGHNLPAHQTDGWDKFDIDLKEGWNTIRVIMDADKQVSESDEANTFAVRVQVNVKCAPGPGGLTHGGRGPNSSPN